MIISYSQIHPLCIGLFFQFSDPLDLPLAGLCLPVMFFWLGMIQFKDLSYFCMNLSSERDVTDEVRINSAVERKAM